MTTTLRFRSRALTSLGQKVGRDIDARDARPAPGQRD